MALARRSRISILIASIALVLSSPGKGVPQTPTPSAQEPQLTLPQIVEKLVEMNLQRAEALEQYRSRRLYRLDYTGFPKSLHAEMAVNMNYTAPATKQFEVLSQSGSKLLLDRVLKKLLLAEQEALKEENRAKVELNNRNYDFTKLEYDATQLSCPYVLTVQPKIPSKLLYRGRIWVDAKDFAICRIEAEPAKNPSFWIKKTDIHHSYLKVGDFWMPSENKSVSSVRFFDRAVLTIQYQDYVILVSHALKKDDTSWSLPAGSVTKHLD